MDASEINIDDLDPIELIAELRRRAKEIEDGTAVGIPAEQVFAEMRTKHSRNNGDHNN